MRWLFPDDPAKRARRDRVLLVLFAALLVFLVARAARKPGGVLVRNQEFGARFLAGEDPYHDPARGHRIHGPYPPGFVWIAAPLSLLSERAARIAWSSLQALSLVAILWVLRRWLRRAAPELAPHFPVLFAAAILLASRFLLRDMAGGGANTVHAALFVVALDQADRRREGLAGSAFAFSLATKPYLAPCLFLFAARRRWRLLCATGLTAAALSLLPGLVYGFERWLALGARWTRDLAAFVQVDDPSEGRSVPEGLPMEDTSMNQSLGAALRRAFAAADAEPGSGAAASGAARAAALALLVVCTVVAWRAHRRRSGPRWPSPRGALAVARMPHADPSAAPPAAVPRAERAADPTAAGGLGDDLASASAALAFLPLCLLASPVTWKAHHVLLLPLFFVLVCAAAGARRKRLAIGALAAYWVLCGLMNEELLGRAGKQLFERLSIVTWADLALLAAALAIAARAQRSRSLPASRFEAEAPCASIASPP